MYLTKQCFSSIPFQTLHADIIPLSAFSLLITTAFNLYFLLAEVSCQRYIQIYIKCLVTSDNMVSENIYIYMRGKKEKARKKGVVKRVIIHNLCKCAVAVAPQMIFAERQRNFFCSFSSNIGVGSTPTNKTKYISSSSS